MHIKSHTQVCQAAGAVEGVQVHGSGRGVGIEFCYLQASVLGPYCTFGTVNTMAAVLVVDDTLFMRASIRQMLEANGHSVAGEASNGVEAIEKYAAVKPDVILMDITMPDMDGLEALRRIKEIDPKAKVIMCTAMGQQAMVAKAVELGAQQFIVKPFQPDRLMAAIDTVCR